MLDFRLTGEPCNQALSPDSPEIRHRIGEGSFRTACMASVPGNLGPNCGGEFVPGPTGPRKEW